jgi:ATP-dependent DNA helicase RecG
MENIHGVGPRVSQKLAKMGVTTVEDAFYTLPFRYEDRRHIRRIAELREGLQEVFRGQVLSCGETLTSKARKRIFEVVVTDGSGTIQLKWFHYRKNWLKNQFAIGRVGLFCGELHYFAGVREIHHPEFEILNKTDSLEDIASSSALDFGRILPVYPLTEGLSQKGVRKIFKSVVENYASRVFSPIPPDILKRHQLVPLDRAFRMVHMPDNSAVVDDLATFSDPGRQSIVFDEFFFLELGLALKRRGVSQEAGIAFQVSHKYTKPLAQMLPFKLTGAQRRVLGEIKQDMMRPTPMNRLIQGDVGCGKTIVALMAALLAIENEAQVAVLAPTEVLAEQHYLQFHRHFEKLGLSVALLAGSTPKSERSAILNDIAAGHIHMLVGTHALLEEDVEFDNLGLGIIDEQHRFGVHQRAHLRRKGAGASPDILVMTATPIPRTLFLTAYGDLSLSVIDALPPGRKPVETKVYDTQEREKVFSFVHGELARWRQVFIVYPLIEESEKVDLLSAEKNYEHLARDVFPENRLGLLHGRLKPAEKEKIMRRFKNREIDILVATTVIEVGIDIANATVMIVENAERFGLAQLHQLRGRVGRGADKSFCFLGRGRNCSADGFSRLKVMQETNDGFRIAEADLEIRGPGEFLGTRQSGLPDFRVANILDHGKLLETARREAFNLVEKENFLTNSNYAELREALHDRWGGRLELASVG